MSFHPGKVTKWKKQRIQSVSQRAWNTGNREAFDYSTGERKQIFIAKCTPMFLFTFKLWCICLCFSQALERDCFGSITPKHIVSPEVQAQRGSLSPEYISPLRRDVATITEPVSEVHTSSRPRRHWSETADRLGRPHEHYRDHTSSEEEQAELELVEREKMRNIHEDPYVARREGKPDNRSHRYLF